MMEWRKIYKDSGVGWLLLNHIDTRLKNNENLRALNSCHWLRVKASAVSYGEAFISCSERADSVEWQLKIPL